MFIVSWTMPLLLAPSPKNPTTSSSDPSRLSCKAIPAAMATPLPTTAEEPAL
jgi:hypothetical protein